MDDVSVEGLVWLAVSMIATLPAVVYFRIWLRRLMKLGRVEPSRSIMLGTLAEWKYLGRLFRPDPDATADLWRRRALWAYGLALLIWAGGFVVFVGSLLADR